MSLQTIKNFKDVQVKVHIVFQYLKYEPFTHLILESFADSQDIKLIFDKGVLEWFLILDQGDEVFDQVFLDVSRADFAQDIIDSS